MKFTDAGICVFTVNWNTLRQVNTAAFIYLTQNWNTYKHFRLTVKEGKRKKKKNPQQTQKLTQI